MSSLRVICSLILGCHGKACLSTCCLSLGVLKKPPEEDISVEFVLCMECTILIPINPPANLDATSADLFDLLRLQDTVESAS